MTKKEIGLAVKRFRKLIGVTQIDFSHKLGISQSKLSKVEHGALDLSATQYLSFLKLKEKKS
jgi:transcriptional regulator with XRE-family HTH domain